MEASIQTSFPIAGETLVDTQFAETVMRQMALPFVPQESSTEAINVAHDVFAPARANLFVVVDGVTSQELNMRDLEVSAAKTVRSSFSPSASAAAMVASLLTGATPREHGIVADKWDYLGETEYAFIHAFPGVASIADVAAQYSLGKSRIVSASASAMYARALGVRPALNSYGDHSVSVQYNVQRSVVEIVAGLTSSPASGLNSADLNTILLSHFRSEVLLDTTEHKALYAELAMILASVSDLSVHAQTATSADLYNFAITALNPIRAIHGSASSEYTSALSLVRRVIARAVEKVQHAYGKDSTIFEILSIRSMPRTASDEEKIVAVALAFNMEESQVRAHYPHIYTSTEAPCSMLPANVEAVCATTFQDRVLEQIRVAGDSISFHRRYTVFQEETNFETVSSWLMFTAVWITMAVIALIIVYAFFQMDIGEDSLLYRMTNIPATFKEQ